MLIKSTASFFIGLFAGVCAVFVPRLGALFTAEDPSRLQIFPATFVALGLVYAAIVGVVVLIVYFDKTGTPADRFMTGLGVPALLAGAIATSAHTGKVEQLQDTNNQLSKAAATASRIQIDETPTTFEPLYPPRDKVSFEMLLGIGTAYAGQAEWQGADGKWSNSWAAIQAQQPNYAILVDKTRNAEDAEKSASKLKTRFPTAAAVKTDHGYGVITGIKPQSAAVLDAIELKKEGLSPELIRQK